MPSSMPPALASKLAEKQGIEPVYLFEIQWAAGGQFYTYSSKKVAGLRSGIIKMATLESIVKLDSKGQSQGMDLTLSDVDSELKNIIDRNDIHGSVVKAYMWESSLPITERTLLMQGEINGPIQWSEGSRSLSFSVVTKLAGDEVGFSPEQGIFNAVPNPLVGVPWPIVFGDVQNLLAIEYGDIPTTLIQTITGAADGSLEAEIVTLQVTIDSLTTDLGNLTASRDSVANQIEEWDAGSSQTDSQDYLQLVTDLGEINAAIVTVTDSLASSQASSDELKEELKNQTDVAGTVFSLQEGHGFPEDVALVVVVDGIRFTGSISGDEFTITSREVIAHDPDFEGLGFSFVQAGSSLRLLSDDKKRFIINLLPSDLSSIIVKAYKGTGADRKLQKVDATLYTVKHVQLSPVFTVTMLEMDDTLSELTKPLEDRDPTTLSSGEKQELELAARIEEQLARFRDTKAVDKEDQFSDELFITQTSPKGPNTVDIIEYLIDTFTELQKDAASFASVRAKVDSTPSHFALESQKDIFTLLAEILFQARCTAWVKNNTVFLKFLPEEADSTDTITDSDWMAGSVQLKSTPMEQVTTKLIAEWTDDLALDRPHKVVLRRNVKKYGIRERTENFYIYNRSDLVVRAATYWILQMSNVWKHAEFEVALNKVSVETFDTITIDASGQLFSDNATKAIVRETSIDSDKNLITMKCWLPILFGTMEQYEFAWPDGATNQFPLLEDCLAGGDAGSTSPQRDVTGDTSFDYDGAGISIDLARACAKDVGDDGEDLTPESPSSKDKSNPCGQDNFKLPDDEPGEKKETFSWSGFGTIVGASSVALNLTDYTVDLIRAWDIPGFGAIKNTRVSILQLQIKGARVPSGSTVPVSADITVITTWIKHFETDGEISYVNTSEGTVACRKRVAKEKIEDFHQEVIIKYEMQAPVWM